MVAVGRETFVEGTITGHVFQGMGLKFDRGPCFLRTTTTNHFHDHESQNGAHDERDKYKSPAVTVSWSEGRRGRALGRCGRCDRDKLVVSLNACVR
jgi:hypothetical protein